MRSKPVPAPALNPDLLALLAGCRAAPADDAPRLILADWLDENADSAGIPADDARARAQFIRVQVELARPTCDTGHLAQLRAAEAQLLSANAARWLGNLPGRFAEVRQRQFGFAARASGGAPPQFDPLATHDGWKFHRGLLTIELSAEELADTGFAAWFASPLAHWVEEVGVELAGLGTLERLRVPDPLRPYLGVRYTLGSSQQGSMRLASTESPLSPQRCQKLIRSESFALVRVLRMDANAVAANALEALAEGNVSGLHRLSIRAPLTDTQTGLLARAPLENLSALDISGCEIGPEAFALLVNSPHLRQLTALVAFRNRFGCDGLTALARSPLAGRLSVLAIQNTGVGDRGVAAMVESPLLERVVGPGLNLSMNPIGDAGAMALTRFEHLGPFSELILRECRIANAGAKALAESPQVANLAYLDLWKNRIGTAGASALAASPHLGKVRELSLRDNAITAKGVKALQKRFGERVKV